MPVVDTSFLIALKDADDKEHRAAMVAARGQGPFVIPGVILHDYLLGVFQHATTVAGKAAGNRTARDALVELRSQPVFLVDPRFDPDEAARIFLTARRLTYADAVAIHVSLLLGEELWTFDKGQADERERVAED